MDKGSTRVSTKSSEGILGIITVGVFFLIVGAIFVVNSHSIQTHLLDRIIAFFKDFSIRRVPNSGVYLPAPAYPLAHSIVYLAAQQFSLVWGLFQIVILAFRFVVGSPLTKKAETVSNIILWIGGSFLISNFLLDTSWLAFWSAITLWFVYWSLILVLLGSSLIVRAIIIAAALKIPAT